MRRLWRRFTNRTRARTHSVRRTGRGLGIGAAAVLALSCAAIPAAAQSTGDGFLFKAPAGAVTVRGGLNRASAGSDVFTFVTAN